MLPTLAENSPENGLDITRSAWVSASAGSGKTTLLVTRVLRLLLASPTLPKMLCLTYTRAAAAEMQNRIYKELGLWASLGDDALRERLQRQGGAAAAYPTISQALLERARCLFAAVLDQASHIRMMTLHAFCQMVLQRFPLEAGLTPGFSLLEGTGLERCREAVFAAFFSATRQQPDLAAAFNRFAAGQSSDRTMAMLGEVFFHPAKWQDFLSSVADYEPQLRRELGLGDASLESITRDLLRAYDGLTAAGIEAHLQGFFTKEGSLRQRNCPPNPEAAVAFVEKRAALQFLQLQCDYAHCATVLFTLLEAWKARHNCLTYDDLIRHTRTLLTTRANAAWVLYKLDGGIDHLLIDEAQDTSPEQWQVVFALLEEFFSGEGVRANRTVFVVGDEKQSIYSFQGADRSVFLAKQAEMAARMAAAGKRFTLLDRSQSYRTTPAVLTFVDAVFADAGAGRGVGSKTLRHHAARHQAAGYVELWEPFAGDPPPPISPWQPPLAREDRQSAPIKLAERIAATIQRWLREGYWLESENRPVAAGDVMILLQRRSSLLAPLVRALKDAAVPVVGVDRMILGQQAAVQDVLGLCRFLLLPEDDLTLAEVLRSPFIRLDDSQLFDLSHHRPASLWARLSSQAEYAAVTAYLKGLLAVTDYLSPFYLLHKLLFTPCPADAVSGQHALTLRLGLDAVDPLDELLNAARRYETLETPSLQGFIQHMTETGQEVKREMSKAAAQVRILTVHAAKGLEAPIVFVPDLQVNPNKKGGSTTPLQWYHAPQAGITGWPLCLGGDYDALPLLAAMKAQQRQAQEEENRRLLYVAMTRARDILILCSAGGSADKISKGKTAKQAGEKNAGIHWQDFCANAFAQLASQTTTLLAEDGMRIQRFGAPAALQRRGVAAPSVATPPTLPDWTRQQVPPEAAPALLHPSRTAPGEATLPPLLGSKQRGGGDPGLYHRGIMLHRLLQCLPEVPPPRRAAVAMQFLRQQSPLHPHDSPTEHEARCAADAAEVLAILNHPAFAPLFSPDAQAEVALVGTLDGRRIAGQIDRLLVTPTEVWVVDFKTNRPPPQNPAAIPASYLSQMAAYAGLLEQIYPQKRLTAALLWTHIPSLMPLSPEMLARGRAFFKQAG